MIVIFNPYNAGVAQEQPQYKMAYNSKTLIMSGVYFQIFTINMSLGALYQSFYKNGPKSKVKVGPSM